MLGRRIFLDRTLKLMMSTSAFAAGTASGVEAEVPEDAVEATGFVDHDPRGSVGRLERLGELDLESKMNFHAGFLRFLTKDMRPVMEERFNSILTDNGLDASADISAERSVELVKDDPVISMRQRTWLSNQQVMYNALLSEFDQHEDVYLKELDSAATVGPGLLELNPKLKIPDFARHEIHIQPGGYVGSPFAGYINYVSVNNFYDALIGANYQDQLQMGIVKKIPLPKKGKVLRILDLGCGTGRVTFALRQRFPDAEIWGLDVAAPMLRFAHMRGVDLGIDVNFRQALASKTGFPSDFFDVVTANILFHETSAKEAKATMREVKRVLRPAGVFYPTDLPNGKQLPKRTAVANFAQWIDHKINHERWRVEWEDADFAQILRRTGFDVDETVEKGGFVYGKILATKPG